MERDQSVCQSDVNNSDLKFSFLMHPDPLNLGLDLKSTLKIHIIHIYIQNVACKLVKNLPSEQTRQHQ